MSPPAEGHLKVMNHCLDLQEACSPAPHRPLPRVDATLNLPLHSHCFSFLPFPLFPFPPLMWWRCSPPDPRSSPFIAFVFFLFLSSLSLFLYFTNVLPVFAAAWWEHQCLSYTHHYKQYRIISNAYISINMHTYNQPLIIIFRQSVAMVWIVRMDSNWIG